MLMRLPTATEKAAFATAFRKQQVRWLESVCSPVAWRANTEVARPQPRDWASVQPCRQRPFCSRVQSQQQSAAMGWSSCSRRGGAGGFSCRRRSRVELGWRRPRNRRPCQRRAPSPHWDLREPRCTVLLEASPVRCWRSTRMVQHGGWGSGLDGEQPHHSPGPAGVHHLRCMPVRLQACTFPALRSSLWLSPALQAGGGAAIACVLCRRHACPVLLRLAGQSLAGSNGATACCFVLPDAGKPSSHRL